MRTPYGRPGALALFDAHRGAYHPVCAKMVAADIAKESAVPPVHPSSLVQVPSAAAAPSAAGAVELKGEVEPAPVDAVDAEQPAEVAAAPAADAAADIAADPASAAAAAAAAAVPVVLVADDAGEQPAPGADAGAAEAASPVPAEVITAEGSAEKVAVAAAAKADADADAEQTAGNEGDEGDEEVGAEGEDGEDVVDDEEGDEDEDDGAPAKRVHFGSRARGGNARKRVSFSSIPTTATTAAPTPAPAPSPTVPPPSSQQRAPKSALRASAPPAPVPGGPSDQAIADKRAEVVATAQYRAAGMSPLAAARKAKGLPTGDDEDGPRGALQWIASTTATALQTPVVSETTADRVSTALAAAAIAATVGAVAWFALRSGGSAPRGGR